MEYFWYVLPACSREHPHQLFEGLERLAKFESYVHLVYPLEIGSKRSEMERIIPLP
jgi:hypothetical protein